MKLTDSNVETDLRQPTFSWDMTQGDNDDGDDDDCIFTF